MSDVKTNREYKDRLFRFLFGNEKNRKHLLILYNALNHTHYENEEELEITTIDDAIYMKMKNDLSFLINSFMPLFEQQSSFNPNMPFREFQYCAKLYNKYIVKNKYDIYGRKLVKIPTPQCYVFYNGSEEKPERMELKLSDAFEVPTKGYEWTSIMLNINEGYNRELMEKCRMLRDYAGFVALIRENALEYPTDEAIDRAVQEYIARGGEFAEFLLMHRSEVVDMCITEYDETLHEQNLLEEGKREGFAEGRKDGLAEGLTEGRKNGLAEGRKNGLEEGLAEGRILSIKNLMSTAGYSVDEAMRLLLIPEDNKEKYKVIILKNKID